MIRPTAYLSVDDILRVHQRVTADFGGDPGLRNRGLLESALAMPQSTFDGADLHVGLAAKAAAYYFHLCSNHPFVDGNKRVAVVAAELFLRINGQVLSATDDEIEQLTVGLAAGRVSKDEVTDLFTTHVETG